MIKLKNTVFENSELGALIKKIDECDGLSGDSIYKFMDLVEKYAKKEELYIKAKQKLFKKLGEEGQNGEILIKEENKDDFYKELNSLLDVDFELDIEPIKYDEALNFRIRDLRLMKDFLLMPTDETVETVE